MTAVRIKFSKERLQEIPYPESGRVEYADTETKGLLLRVSASGRKVFCLHRWMKSAGKAGRVTLGTFPQMTVEQARKLAAKMNAEVEGGNDPGEVKRVLRSELTLAELFHEFIANKRNKRGAALAEKTRLDYGKQFETYLKDWHTRKLSKVRTEDIRALHTKLGKDRKPTANRSLALVSSMYSFAIEHGLFSGANPARGIKPYKENERERFLQSDELPRFFRALAEEENTDIRDYFLVSLLTGARKSNVLAMRWADVNLDRAEWRIPITKNGTPQTVALAPVAVEILRGREQGEWVFPGVGKTGHLVEPKKGWCRVLERAGLSDLRIHDLRRTLGSWQAKTGASLSIIGKSLNHKTHQATQIYARLDLDPVRASVERATNAMLTAGGLKEAADVVPIQKKR